MTELVNPGFDGLNGWPIWSALNNPTHGLPAFEIQHRATEPPEKFHSGDSSLQITNHWKTWHAGVLQHVNAGVLARVKFGAWAKRWARNEGLFPSPSDQNVHSRFWIGIDPNGGTDPLSSGVVSKSIVLDDDWIFNSVEAVSLTELATVFIGIENGVDGQWPLQFMVGLIDDASLVVTPGTITPPPPNPPPVAVATGISISGIVDVGNAWQIVVHIPKTV